ncbi:MAG: ROK family glucokinase [Bacillota bacterium]|uniref:Glucokinase n=1 Tax=Virgibacillus salarius TaxID=447199 RepID=A0A941DZW3_9BACI|nr:MULTISPECIES: ROK family glucokinase [Bacillaceae]MBR7798119.1 ROK family glucokinase [Virgibacillus salarius]MDY7046105.1 ROK family glucokinase [Virgibacillus sp. M23]NAZ10828.1 ROK family glucokinase [Agaribacter marinus]WBX79147.1 ROK family glucokinase [Virgibacillus salarius]
MNQIIIGVDVGGTTAKLGFINNQGDILRKWEIPTITENEGIQIVDDIWNSIERQLSHDQYTNDQVLGIGVGAPGFIEDETGFVYEAVNIGWKNYDLGNQLKQRSNLPVFVENDANIAVLGENWKGAGNQARNLVAITLGTGVGGGIITNGQIVNGEAGIGGEIGHITIDIDGYTCNCGRIGCLETIVSATGIVRQAMEKAENQSGLLATYISEHGSITAKDVFQFAAAGDKSAREIVKNTADVLGMAISNIGTIVNPAKVLIGGGVSKAGEAFLYDIRESFDKYALSRVSENCELKLAQLGNDAGIIGAAFLVKQKIEHITFTN